MEKTLKVVCIGDSITEGFGIAEDPLGPYPAQLQKLLGKECQVFNQGVSCTCTVNRIKDGKCVGMPYVQEEKWKTALEIAGDIYVVMLGTNDAQDGYNEEENREDPQNNVFAFREYFEEDYMKIVHEIHEKVPDTVIFSVKPVPVMESIWRKHQQSFLEKILKKIDEIWKKNPWLMPVDMQEIFMKYPWEERKKLYQKDGLHPNKLGAELIAETVGKSIIQWSQNVKR